MDSTNFGENVLNQTRGHFTCTMYVIPNTRESHLFTLTRSFYQHLNLSRKSFTRTLAQWIYLMHKTYVLAINDAHQINQIF